MIGQIYSFMWQFNFKKVSQVNDEAVSCIVFLEVKTSVGCERTRSLDYISTKFHKYLPVVFIKNYFFSSHALSHSIAHSFTHETSKILATMDFTNGQVHDTRYAILCAYWGRLKYKSLKTFSVRTWKWSSTTAKLSAVFYLYNARAAFELDVFLNWLCLKWDQKPVHLGGTQDCVPTVYKHLRKTSKEIWGLRSVSRWRGSMASYGLFTLNSWILSSENLGDFVDSRQRPMVPREQHLTNLLACSRRYQKYLKFKLHI